MTHTRSGMSLLEVLVALTVLALGFGAAFSAMFTARKVDDSARNAELAFQEIQAQLETYQYLPFISLQTNFKGASFDVQGLTPPKGVTQVGSVTKAANPSPDDTTLSPTNPNAFTSSDTKLPLRFRCTWVENGNPVTVEVYYVLTYRGI